ncbi:MAG: hypothetical protein V1781_07160 [Bacteroidota bacterium]
MKIDNFKKSTLLITYLLSAAIMISVIQSCVKDNFEFNKLTKTEWNPNIAVPLVYSSLTIQDILNRSNQQNQIIVGSDNFCTLIYRGNLFSLSASDLIQIPNQQPPSYSAPLSPAQIAVLSSIGTVTASYSQTVNFVSGTNSPEIDSVIFKTGNISISLNSDFRFSGQIVIKIPAAKKNGVVFSKTLLLAYSGSVPVIATANYDLAGYTFDMTNGGTIYNQFAINYDITLTGSGTPPLTTNEITFNQSLSDMKFDKLFGDIGQLALSPDKDTVALSIFRNAFGTGNFTLVNPKIKIVISNSYGVPIAANISQFDGYKPKTGNYSITGSPNPLPIYSPNFSQIGQNLTGSFTLDNSNSNIVSVINNIPEYVIYKINSQTNPSGATHNNFVIDSSHFKVDMEIEMPLWGTAKNFSLIDTADFKMDQTIIDDIESGLFRVYNSNGFPIDIEMQIYFTDSIYNKLDSLMLPNQLILQSAIVNLSTGIVISPTQKTYDVVFTKTKLENLKRSKHILIKAVANTTNGGNTNVKFYSDYKLDVKLGVQIQIKKKI